MKTMKLYFFLLAIAGGFLITSCGDEEPGGGTGGDDPISSFQFTVSETNFLEVNFMNFSQNATSYEWDFGDGKTSTEESPSHTYDGAGDYDVVLKAIGNGTDKSSTKSISITDPTAAAFDLTGGSTKVWKLSRDIANEEFPIQVGPNSESEIWWALGINDPVGARPCIMEEEYIFGADGSFKYDPKGSVFADFGIWNVDVEGQCVDATDASVMVGPNGEDLSAWGAGDFTFDYDVANGTLTVNGLGAHIGLPKVASGTEVASPQPSVTYDVVSIDTDGPIDKLVLRTQLTAADGYWQFRLVSYDNPADEPELPGAAPTVGFDYVLDGKTATFTNASVNADSYMWDFGDGMTSNDESPVHTYASDGAYDVTLSATNADGTNSSTLTLVISTDVTFNASVLHGDASKEWTLKPIAAALAVGPNKGSQDWWSNSEEDVMGRDCTFDDIYTFDNAAGFEYKTNGDLWAEMYMGGLSDGCYDESALVDPFSAWGSGSHSFEVTEANGSEPAFITVTGTGAFIALPKARNGAEYSGEAPIDNESVKYEVLSYLVADGVETIVLAIDVSPDGGVWWRFTLESK